MKVRKCSVNCFANSVPTVLVVALLGWSVVVEYGFFVPPLLRSTRSSTVVLGSVCVAAYTFLWALCVSHFVACFLADNSPAANPPSDASVRRLEQLQNQHWPECPKCHGPKPMRCHHCRVCQSCTLRMDHHCPWVGNCVGFFNYKFFFMFLLFAFLLCLFVIGTSVPFIVSVVRGHSFNGTVTQVMVICHAMIALVFSLSVSALFFAHCSLLAKNLTTLEQPDDGCIRPSGGESTNPFNLGVLRNIEQILGPKKLLWILPIHTAVGDGYAYPVRRGWNPETPQNAATTAATITAAPPEEDDRSTERTPLGAHNTTH